MLVFVLWLPTRPVWGEQQKHTTKEANETEPNPATASSVAVVNNQPFEDHQQTAADKPQRRPPLWDIYWPNLALAILAVIAAGIGLETLWIIKRQTDITEQTLLLTHRPKITIRNIVIPELTKLNRQSPMNQWSAALVGYYTLANVGGFSATIQNVVDGIWAEKGLPMERPDRGRPERGIGVILAPGESTEISFNVVLGADDACRIIDGDFAVYILVQVIYVDNSKVVRKTSACRKFDLTEQRFTRVDDPDYEYAD
ncbi:MAG: hypothetical protein ABSD63_08310 [Candidatus Korobacteraceae bacterium]|jgi:hypothetical protein